jgi:hypothetical protein
VSNALVSSLRLPGTKAHLHGHGGKRLDEVPFEDLVIVRDQLLEVPGASKYTAHVDAINGYLDMVRLSRAD